MDGKKRRTRRDFQFTYPVIFIDWNSIKIVLFGFYYNERASERWDTFLPVHLLRLLLFDEENEIEKPTKGEIRKLIPWTVWISSSNKCYSSRTRKNETHKHISLDCFCIILITTENAQTLYNASLAFRMFSAQMLLRNL